jgi:hypothetical protein
MPSTFEDREYAVWSGLSHSLGKDAQLMNIDGTMISEGNRTLIKLCTLATSSIMNMTLSHLELNQGLSGKKPATNFLSYNTLFLFVNYRLKI